MQASVAGVAQAAEVQTRQARGASLLLGMVLMPELVHAQPEKLIKAEVARLVPKLE